MIILVQGIGYAMILGVFRGLFMGYIGRVREAVLPVTKVMSSIPPLVVTSAFGGSDNHNIMKHGINGIVLLCGMFVVHSVSEYTKAGELVRVQLLWQNCLFPSNFSSAHKKFSGKEL